MGIFRDRFEQPQQFYEQLDPQQQQVVGQQFQQEFAQSQDPYVQQQGWGQMDPSQLDPQQLGQMHGYAEQRDPSILHRVMGHPVLDVALVQGDRQSRVGVDFAWSCWLTEDGEDPGGFA
jgi:hypothetical protein